SDFQVGLENVEGWTGHLAETDTDFSGNGIAFRRGDILFGKLRPYLAKVWFSDRAGQAVGDFFVLRPSLINGEFLHKYILTPTVINELDASTIGAKMPRVDWESMAALEVTLPSPSEQTQIAHFLD
ncbi:restriction endonuclease subunit S, partial [Ectothiorhodospira haloalkaliphila]|uniref:restriction endonuclease subunit S n=1 Tax=Ectothiorhodospira haloalkaliphila TaxID=421628 RepID=UPI001EE8338A